MEAREIKFRAWDDINKEMIYPHAIPTSFTLLKSGDILNRYEIVTQFTGIKDCKGKDIYEGDILEFLGGGFAEVTYKNACFYTFKKKSNYRLGGWDKNTIKVVGNIFENPELLELIKVDRIPNAERSVATDADRSKQS